jgi:diketogulonate reductase-like aldo/keto reductase
MATTSIRTILLPDGEAIPVLGHGSWNMGEIANRRKEEAAALRLGIDLGMTVIDTAEMYGDGATERFLGEALAGLREQVFLVSKAYPQNAGRQSLPKACERSLSRLKTDRLDLYLLHWPGSIPLEETVEAMEALKRAGKIRHWGVSNFDTDDMEELMEAGGEGCAVNQILYNPTRRGPEYDLLPWMTGHDIPLMAYSPVEQGRLPGKGALREVAERHDASPAQVALAWILRRPDAIAIPKASSPAHLRENRAAAELTLTPDDLAALDGQFPPPSRKVSLQML